MYDIKEMADKADVIVNGYAFYKKEDGVSILNLNRLHHAATIRRNGEVIETSMDDIELEIAKKYLATSWKYMEA